MHIIEAETGKNICYKGQILFAHLLSANNQPNCNRQWMQWFLLLASSAFATTIYALFIVLLQHMQWLTRSEGNWTEIIECSNRK